MNECPHELDPRACVTCQSPARGRRVRDNRRSRVMAARYAGECPGCPFGIEPGHDVQVRGGRWWHVTCAEAVAR